MMYDDNFKPHPDAEMREFEEALLASLKEAKAGIGRVTTAEQLTVRAARRAVGMTQEAFAERIHTPVATLRDWEQGRFAPPGGVLCLMRIIAAHPELAEELATA